MFETPMTERSGGKWTRDRQRWIRDPFLIYVARGGLKKDIETPTEIEFRPFL
jgi:hypothetical protein